MKSRFSPSRLLICGLVLTLLQSQIVVAEAAIVVVVRKNSPLPQLSRDEVIALFLGKTRRSNDVSLIPFDSKDNALRDRFYQEIAEMSTLRVKAYWSRIVFSGQGRPPQEISISEARVKLTDEPGALLYLSADQVTPDMKVVFRMSKIMHHKH